MPHASSSSPRPHYPCSLSSSDRPGAADDGSYPPPKRQRREPAETDKHDEGSQATDVAVDPTILGSVSAGTVPSHERDCSSDRLGAQVQEGKVDSDRSSVAAPNLSAVIGHLQHLFARMQYSKGRLVFTTQYVAMPVCI